MLAARANDPLVHDLGFARWWVPCRILHQDLDGRASLQNPIVRRQAQQVFPSPGKGRRSAGCRGTSSGMRDRENGPCPGATPCWTDPSKAKHPRRAGHERRHFPGPPRSDREDHRRATVPVEPSRDPRQTPWCCHSDRRISRSPRRLGGGHLLGQIRRALLAEVALLVPADLGADPGAVSPHRQQNAPILSHPKRLATSLPGPS